MKTSDDHFKKMLQQEAMHKAPEGMTDRIMASVMVQSSRRLVVQAKPNPAWAWVMVVLTSILIALGVLLKPEASSLFSWIDKLNFSIQLSIDALWILPVVVFSLAIWFFILLENKMVSSEKFSH